MVDTKEALRTPTIKLTNLGRTTITLLGILALISLSVSCVIIVSGQEFYLSNPPDLTVPIDFLASSVGNALNTITDGYTKIRNSFAGKEDFLVENSNLFICPIEKSNFFTIFNCLFTYKDTVVVNVMDAIPSYARYITNSVTTFIQTIAPQHFVLEEAYNSFKSFLQRFIALNNPATEKPRISDRRDEVSEEINEKASFRFPTFPEDVADIRTLCEDRCSEYATLAKNYMFVDVEQQSSLVPTPMTKYDYFFNELNADMVFFCQYEEDSNSKFGGTWLAFDESCVCSDNCDASDFFDFTGCADLLNRVGIACSLETPCTIDRICKFENHKIELKDGDPSSKLSNSMNSICLDVCAELAGFADFATLAGISGSLGALSSNAFGLANTPFGTALGVPAALIPSNYDFNFIAFRSYGV